MHEIEHASYQQAEFALVTGEDIGSIGAGRHGEIGCVPPDLRDYDDAVSGVDAAGWRASMAEERRSLIEHGVFKWVDPPDGIQAIPSRFLCRWKYNQGGVACRQKSRVVVQNFREADTGADKAAPVASQEPVHILIANAVKRDLILRRPDVKTAFLQTGMGGCVDVWMCVRHPSQRIRVPRGTGESSMTNESVAVRPASLPPWLVGHDAHVLAGDGFYLQHYRPVRLQPGRRIRFVILYVHDILKRVLKYPRGTISIRLTFSEDAEHGGKLTAYVDTDHAGDIDKANFFTGVVVYFVGAPVDWKCR